MRTPERFDEDLFKDVLRALPPSAYPKVLWSGLNIDQLFRVSAKTCRSLMARRGIEIVAERPFLRRRFDSVRSYLDALGALQEQHLASFILGLEWVRESGGHWSVYRGREGGKLRLYDSGATHSLTVQPLTLSDTRANRLVPRETVMFRLVSVDGDPIG